MQAGAEALGFVFAPSRRKIPVDLAGKICGELPGNVAKVGVFVNHPRKEVEYILKYTGLNTLQFHGDESPEYCSGWAVPVWKAIRVQSSGDILRLDSYDVDAYVLDSYSSDHYGGSGRTFDWQAAQKAVKSGYKIILAGGLTPANVQQAIQVVAPHGVDVSSGVERSGRKDLMLIAEFIRKVREAHA